ncbi:MAG TPA: hypothetical protein EYO17_00155 [Dehalococcoidia bacterium]|nr:hypothetical protein [Dehalococcoidia bacterium]
MATQQGSQVTGIEVVPDFLLMDSPGAAPKQSESEWYGWPTKELKPVTLLDDQGRTMRVRTPMMDMEGLITPVDLHYVVQHFDVPPVADPTQWKLEVTGEVKRPLTIDYEMLRRYPGRTVRTVMECSGSDATFFEYFKGEGPKPSRTSESMILSASEWTGVPLAAVLNDAGLTGKATHVRGEGWDKGVPATAIKGTEPFYYDKALPIEKALHPDTLIAVAQNGKLLEHLHGAPARLIVPGWSGNWSVKWLWKLQVLDHEPPCWYHYNFYYYGDSADDPNKELITTIAVRSIITQPNDDTDTMDKGVHVVRGYAWSGGGPINQVELSLDGGKTWNATRLEGPQDQYMWVRWSYLWDAQKAGKYTLMARATDAAGREQSQTPRYNIMRKNFSAIVGYDITIK